MQHGSPDTKYDQLPQPKHSHSSVRSDTDTSMLDCSASCDISLDGSVLDSSNNNLSESFASLDISDSPKVEASTPKVPFKQKFPNLVTPRKSSFPVTVCLKEFSKISYTQTIFSNASNSESVSSNKDRHSGPKLSDLGGLSEQIEVLKARILRCKPMFVYKS